jgi:hypothetical protein
VQAYLAKSNPDIALEMLSVQPFSFNIVRKILHEHRNLFESS